MLNKIFKDQLENINFVRWLGNRLGIQPSKFETYVKNWRSRNFSETRGRLGLSVETKQKIYDTWIAANSINSTDARNGRNVISISKQNYITKFGDLENKEILVEEKKNKRGRSLYYANKMIITCTVRDVVKQLSEGGISVSLEKVMSLRHFFISVASENEIALCLCKLCLNLRMLYDHLLCKAKKDGDLLPQSISNYFMNSCECQKDQNGYFKVKCITQKCSDCKDVKPPELKCQNSEEITSVHQFELTEKS